MKNFSFGRKLEHLRKASSISKFGGFHLSANRFTIPSFHLSSLVYKLHPFFLHVFYFLTVSLAGYFALSVTKPRDNNASPATTLNSFDIFFTSVSAATDSSMATLEMEVFSNVQLIVITILMLLGGEIFISLLFLHLEKSKFPKISDQLILETKLFSSSTTANPHNQMELGLVLPTQKQSKPVKPNSEFRLNHLINRSSIIDDDMILKYNSIRYLCYIVLVYLLVVHIGGSSLVSFYMSLVPSARQILKNKNLQLQTFSVFTVVSTFSNCGFVPTNENMIIFKKNSGLLLILIPQVLLGNTLYPAFLRLTIWVLNRVTKRKEFDYLLTNFKETGYGDLMSGPRCCLLAVTAFGFVSLQLLIFLPMEWNNLEAMEGLNSYQRIIASLFQITNTRHAGESVFDLSVLSPPILLLFVVMMYLPPYISFVPARYLGKETSDCETKENDEEKKNKSLMESLLLSPLAYLVIFILLICIVEKEKMKNDPRNFNVLNITFEVISAYGNVGLSAGYSCKRRLNLDAACEDAWYGFVGRWSNKGKSILIMVMIFGRLKKFVFDGGKAWKLT